MAGKVKVWQHKRPAALRLKERTSISGRILSARYVSYAVTLKGLLMKNESKKERRKEGKKKKREKRASPLHHPMLILSF